MRSLFIERSIYSVLSFLKDAAVSDDIARGKGLLQSLDPRVKIFILLFFLIIILMASSIAVVSAIYAAGVLLAVFSGVNIVYFLKRVWLFIPLFTLFIALPAVFLQGFYSAALFVIRVATCVSFVVLFTVTTRHNALLRSLRSLGVPIVFVEVFDMTYRYIFLFIEIFENMHMALKAKIIRRISGRASRRWIASRIGYLFKRSVEMSEEVYMAQVARSYNIEKR